MSKKTRLNRTVRRAVERQLEKTAPKQPAWRSRTAKVLVFVIGVPGVFASLVTFLPRVIPTLSDPVDIVNPFSSSVTITNNGSIPLHNVTPFVAVGQIVTTGRTPDYHFIPTYQGPRFTKVEWGFPRDMAIDERFGFPLNDLWDTRVRGGLEYADIAIVIQYEIPIIHLKRESIFPFVTQRQTNGHLYWYPKLMKSH
jgi:hypothetical protein